MPFPQLAQFDEARDENDKAQRRESETIEAGDQLRSAEIVLTPQEFQ